MAWFYNVILWMVLAAIWPYLFVKYLRNSEGWRERLGAYPAAKGKTVWIHAASVGEATAISALVEKFDRSTPQFTVFITVFTRTGKLRARQLYGDRVYYAPLDFPFSVVRAWRQIRPEALILTESELWPNLAILASRASRLFLINGRMTAKSHKRYRMLGGLMRTVLGGFTHLMVQSEEHATRFVELGADRRRITITGNMKSDATCDPLDRGLARSKLGFRHSTRILVAGSTREGEEEVVLGVFRPLRKRVTLILAPRHPERVPKIEQMIESEGFSYERSSTGGVRGKEILLVDRLGELRSMYAVGDMAFIGGSLLPYGGHNPLEAAACGIPVLFGPHMENAGSRRLRESGGGIEVASEAEFGQVIARLLDDPEEVSRRGESARRVFDEGRGATEKVFDLILNEIDEKKG